MNKTMKLVFILIIIIIVSASTTLQVFAVKYGPTDVGISYIGDVTEVKNMAGRILGLIRNVAIIAGVLLIAFMGFKFMLGSIEEKSEYKKSFMPLIIGIVIVMSATSIVSFIFSTMDNKIYAKMKVSEDTSGAPGSVPKYVCSHCEDPLTQEEQNRGRCSTCGAYIK